MRRLAILGGSLALAASAAPAHAIGPVRVKHMVVSFDVRVLHVTDWRLWTVPASQTEPSWTHASGTQTLEYATKKPFVARVSAYKPAPGLDLPPLLIMPRHVPRARLTAQRRVSWLEHQESLCDREGGCGGKDRFVREWRPKTSCPTKRLPTTLGLDLGDRNGEPAVQVTLGEPPSPLWTACAPDGGERRLGTLLSGQVRSPLLRDSAVRRIQRLRKGRTVTLKAEFEGGWDGTKVMRRCPARLTGTGHFQECSVTDVVVEARRLR